MSTCAKVLMDQIKSSARLTLVERVSCSRMLRGKCECKNEIEAAKGEV